MNKKSYLPIVDIDLNDEDIAYLMFVNCQLRAETLSDLLGTTAVKEAINTRRKFFSAVYRMMADARLLPPIPESSIKEVMSKMHKGGWVKSRKKSLGKVYEEMGEDGKYHVLEAEPDWNTVRDVRVRERFSVDFWVSSKGYKALSEVLKSPRGKKLYDKLCDMKGKLRAMSRLAAQKKQAAPANEELVGQSLHDVLCTLRTMYVHYQNLHWESKGANFYGDHLMFQRLYEVVAEETDTVAEKILGLTGNPLWVSDRHSLQHGFDTIQIWYEIAGAEDGVSRALFSEAYFLEQLDYVRSILEDNDSLTYGLDDMLSSFASKHEEHIYLLRQRLTKVASQKVNGAGHHFHDNPEKKELRQFQESKAKGNAIKNVPPSAPPTPSDILEERGKEFSTLSRYVIDTAQPTKKPMPSSRAELPKQAKRVRLTRSK